MNKKEQKMLPSGPNRTTRQLEKTTFSWDRCQHAAWFTSCLGLGLWQTWLCVDKYLGLPTTSNMEMLDYGRTFEPSITVCPEGWAGVSQPRLKFDLLASKYNLTAADYLDRGLWWSPNATLTPEDIYDDISLQPADFLSNVTIESDTSSLLLRPEEAAWLAVYPHKSKIRCYTLQTRPTYPELQAVTFTGRSLYSLSALLHHTSQVDREKKRMETCRGV